MANEDIYDLGDIDRGRKQPIFSSSAAVSDRFVGAPTQSSARPRPLRSTAHRGSDAGGVGGALAGSLSIFVPGLGQLLAGEIAWGLFYLTGIGFCAATLWALFGTLERIVPILRLLDVPSVVLVVVVISLAGLTMLLHVAAVLHAHATAPGGEHYPPHPIVAGIASVAIPGWGQLLAGHRGRAGLFFVSVWTLGTAWLMVTPAGTQIVNRLGLTLPSAIKDGWGPAALLATPLVMWVIAVYDAAAGAASERRRR